MLLDHHHVIHDRLDCCHTCQKWHTADGHYAVNGECHRSPTALEIADGTRGIGPVPERHDHCCIHYIPDMRRRDQMAEDLEAAERAVSEAVEEELAAGRHMEITAEGWIKFTGEPRAHA